MAAAQGTAPGLCVFSGGTAANSLVDVFNRLTEKKRRPLTYIIPISDNGGSSSELIRVLGGPSEFFTFTPSAVSVRGKSHCFTNDTYGRLTPLGQQV